MPEEVEAVAFGASCDIDTEDVNVVVDGFRLTREEAIAQGFNSQARHSRGQNWPSAAIRGIVITVGRRMGRYPEKWTVGIVFEEFVEISDGRHLILRDDRGFCWGSRRRSQLWKNRSRQTFTEDLNYWLRQVLDHDDEQGKQNGIDPPERLTLAEWTVERVRCLYGIEISTDSVEDALQRPVVIELGDRLRESLPQ